MADIWSEAFLEAVASAPADEIIISTLELIHPAFVDEEDNPESLRAVLDDRDWTLELEPNAPLHGGDEVLFEKLAIRVTLPEQTENNLGSAKIAMDNVPRKYIKQLEQATSIRANATLIYREWIGVHDPETGVTTVSGPPDFIIGNMTIQVVEITDLRIEATARFQDLLNQGFPLRKFTREEWPALFGG